MKRAYSIFTPGSPAMRAFASRTLLAGLGWWIVSEGQVPALVVGVPAVLAAAALSLRLAPPARHVPHPLGLLLFLGFFLRRSLVAGLEVAWRILQPVPHYEPEFSRVPLYLPDGGPRLLLANCMSLLPGTLSVAIEGDTLLLHRLQRDVHDHADLRDVERRIAHLFKLQLDISQ